LDKQGEVSPISNEGKKLLEQCRVKKKTLLSHENRKVKIRSKVDELVAKYKQASEDKELKSEVDKFFDNWETTVKRYNISFTNHRLTL